MPHSARTAALLDLDATTASSLNASLIALGFQGSAKPTQADLVFCSNRSQRLGRLLRDRSRRVVVVGRDDSENAWLSALEAGAADYLCESFEPIQIRWLVQSLLGQPQAVAA
ncbi:MAG: hypothetical protein U0Q16_02060 [Bryobacteraceae bacterium]